MPPKYYDDKANIRSQRYQSAHLKQIKFGFSLEYDADILAKLDSVPNKQGYIKDLIRADIARKNSNEEEKKMYNVDFQMGPGRDFSGDVDYMLVTVGDVELYAEEPIPDSVRPETTDVNDFDEECYPRLKAAIIDQANAAGIDPDTLKFWWD